MASYRVIALSVGGLRNKIYRSGDIVTDDCWQEGRAQELVEQGFLQPLDIGQESSDTNEKGIDDYTAREIKLILDERKIPYASNAGKAALYDLMRG